MLIYLQTELLTNQITAEDGLFGPNGYHSLDPDHVNTKYIWWLHEWPGGFTFHLFIQWFIFLRFSVVYCVLQTRRHTHCRKIKQNSLDTPSMLWHLNAYSLHYLETSHHSSHSPPAGTYSPKIEKKNTKNKYKNRKRKKYV